MLSLWLILSGIVSLPLTLNLLLMRFSGPGSNNWFQLISNVSLLPFAFGTLIGDIFLHTIPHLYNSSLGHDHSNIHDNHQHHSHEHHHHDYHAHEHHEYSHAVTNQIGMLICVGILLFMLINRWLHSTAHQHGNSCSHSMTADTSDAARSQHQHHHHHGSRHHNGSSEDADDEQESPVAVNESSATLRNRRKRTGVSNAGATASAQPLVDSKVDNSLGWMTLVTSMVHTATDGLTLAITYHLRPNPATVYAAAFAVLLHEIPHGLANYAILLQAGFSPSKAVLMQLLTGVGTFVGALSAKLTVPEGDMALANQVSFNGTTSKVMAIVTGGLLYTAMCGLLPQVMNSANGSSLAAFSIRLLLIFAGIYLMALIGEFE